LVESWAIGDKEPLSDEVQDALQSAVRAFTQHQGLTSGPMAEHIENSAQAGTPTDTGNTPGEVLAGILAKMEEQIVQPVAHSDPANWAKQALGRVRDWVGSGTDEEQELNEWRKTRLARVLITASQKVAEQWDQQIGKHTLELTSLPGARIAAAEIALQKLQRFFLEAAEKQKTLVQQQGVKTMQAYQMVEAAVEGCSSGGGGVLFFFGRSKGRNLRQFMDQLTSFAHARLKEELLNSVRHCYANLAGRLAERLRDLGFCRQRLRHLQQNLEHGQEAEEASGDSRSPGHRFVLGGNSPIINRARRAPRRRRGSRTSGAAFLARAP
jgi:hypothetical protein